ncbi:SbcC/MukB-like Walker B domain-containing protein [Aureimonas ureilytica]|uniref:SbcC/MukB-like Walker B domain-containing protein n=1 Tax=Aureimonas ureilytica TaxID=401562 RepID=UPI00036FD80E|nr:SbcC/MukB-like Walker B domain-containing protein [Aureimonas ureilytica]
MYSLSRISLINWYLIDAKDIEIRGEAALIGPTGAGKSSIQDAIQSVITGVNQNRLNLNASASGRSSRSVLEYCLGMTGDPAEDGKPLRASCETILALTFRNYYTEEPITVGVALSARHGDSREEVLSRFVIPGHAFSVAHVRRRAKGVTTVAPWSEIAASLRAEHPGMEEFRNSAEKFTAHMLGLMRNGATVPNPKHFLRAFSNALAFKPIFDPTLFVRDFVLEPDPLDVERVRTSIATWRELERLIADVEARHKHAARIAERFRLWAGARLAADRQRWRAAALEARRLAHELKATRAVLQAREGELKLERGVLESRREWIRGWDEEIRSKEALLGAAGGEAQLRQIDAEAKLAARDLAEAEKTWARLREALTHLVRLNDALKPSDGRAADAARQALALVPAELPPGEALRGRGERLQALIEEATRAESWQHELDEKADALLDETRRLQERLERVEAGLQRPQGALLSREATKLLTALQSDGIPAVPLCDVVEVADPSWQYAAEALLGRGREAIIVQPPLLQRAFDLMWSDRNTYSGCTLVKTSATRSTHANVASGSIVEALRTADEHARAFLAVRIGAFRKAETDAELDRLDRGVMRNGKTSSGMGLSVQRDLRELLFGRGGGGGDLSDLKSEAITLRARLTEARDRLRTVRDAGRLLGPLLDTLRAEPGPFDLEHRLGGALRRRETLSRDRALVEESDAKGLRAELADIRTERDAHAAELREEVEPRVQSLQQIVASARAKADMALTQLRAAVTQRRRAWALLDAEPNRALLPIDRDGGGQGAPAVCATLRAEWRAGEASRADALSWLANQRNLARAATEDASATARREQLSALRDLAEYAATWRVSVPPIDADGMAAGCRFVFAEVERLENNELRGYRESCAKAGEEMRRILREDLLTRLSDKLGKVTYRLEGINRLLKRHRFTGQTYAFTFAVNGKFQRMHELALKAAEGELTDEVFETSMDEVEAMIEGGEDAAQLADYRQYYTFEIVMTDANGGRTTLSSRALKGSGGEAQVPFYVAIAASLALAYFPGHIAGRPVGMGLALFDEAFNKLDVPNTQALLRFFRDLGLQVLIAGPEDKRATFTEVLDTIILVNKALDGRAVYIDTEHPGEAAKAALAALNPDHRGVEGFRSAAE